jgi:NAD(P)-dependent dehydrogenase (short-subunit alcohol dehydrogenase family)
LKREKQYLRENNMGKYIIITGVSSGIGEGLAAHYLKEGHHVIGTVRKESDAVELSVNENFHKIIFDVKDRNGLTAFVQSIKNILKDNPLYALINNAGIVKAGPLECISADDFEEQIDVNVLSVQRITNAMIPLLGNDSRIVNISSVSGLFNSPFTGPYCISKHALESMSDIYRRELAQFGTKVIAIEPGPIKTKIWSKSRGTLDKYKDSRYGHLVSKADKMIDNAENGALPVSEICKVCDKALFNENPRTRYIIHKKKNLFKLFTMLPDKVADYLVAKNLKGGERHRMV